MNKNKADLSPLKKIRIKFIMIKDKAAYLKKIFFSKKNIIFKKKIKVLVR